MTTILNKISSYNLVNYILPGTIFYIALNKLFNFEMVEKYTLFESIIVYYFLGLLLSRFGSLVIETTLKKIKFIKFKDYNNYVECEKKDSKIALLSEKNNMYRTFLSVFVILLILYLALTFVGFIIFSGWTCTLLFGFTLLFSFSYRKQTQYIFSRCTKIQHKS